MTSCSWCTNPSPQPCGFNTFDYTLAICKHVRTELLSDAVKICFLFCCNGDRVQINTPDYKKHIKGMFHNEPCLYGHRIFSRSAAIYAAVRGLPPPILDDDSSTTTILTPDAVPTQTQASIPETPAGTSRTSRDKATSGRGGEDFEFESRAEKRLSFSLVFQTLKC
jgi:hypothetical protein